MTNDTSPVQQGPEYEATNKRKILMAMFGLAVGSTFVEWLVGSNQAANAAISILTGVGYVVGAVLWTSSDARERGIRTGTGLRLAMIVLLPCALFYYLVRSRGLRGIVSFCLLFLSCLVVYFLVIFELLALSLISDRMHAFHHSP